MVDSVVEGGKGAREGVGGPAPSICLDLLGMGIQPDLQLNYNYNPANVDCQFVFNAYSILHSGLASFSTTT